MKVKEHLEDESIFGKRVWNAKKTNQGTIVEFCPTDRYPSISIDWDNGNKSYRQFIMCLEIEFV